MMNEPPDSDYKDEVRIKLNLVERWFGLLTEKQLRLHQSSGELEAAIYRYLVTNEDPKPLDQDR